MLLHDQMGAGKFLTSELEKKKKMCQQITLWKSDLLNSLISFQHGDL